MPYRGCKLHVREGKQPMSTEDDAHDPYTEAEAVIAAHSRRDGGGCCGQCHRAVIDGHCDAAEVEQARMILCQRNRAWYRTGAGANMRVLSYGLSAP